MQQRSKVWLLIGIVVILIAVGVGVVYFPKRQHGFVAGSVHDNVTQIVKTWANTPALPDDDSILEVLWSKSGGHFEFYPYAAQDLAGKLISKFKDSTVPVILYTDINGAANPQGKVKTVGQLAEAVRLNYSPH